MYKLIQYLSSYYDIVDLDNRKITNISCSSIQEAITTTLSYDDSVWINLPNGHLENPSISGVIAFESLETFKQEYPEHFI